MQLNSVYKVPNGKLLKISLKYNKKNDIIEGIRITGDFFAYPEEAIEIIEHALQQTLFSQKHILEKISLLITRHNIEFIGLNAEELTKGILMCKP